MKGSPNQGSQMQMDSQDVREEKLNLQPAGRSRATGSSTDKQGHSAHHQGIGHRTTEAGASSQGGGGDEKHPGGRIMEVGEHEGEKGPGKCIDFTYNREHTDITSSTILRQKTKKDRQTEATDGSCICGPTQFWASVTPRLRVSGQGSNK